ncbi:hypothetical protein MOQ_000665 [Trypanosoma cruzi marinkellei]|uniref:t-SNARE coiled-coil homology domain-containing protein n=1 Tax=Trypanosoma cruzi marinkellei TaxID=85056 RepID=K2NMZ4_TRYCR|nr:hypothetical protein MOQ_000665 [Trypanosoma cruzi marinkellei]
MSTTPGGAADDEIQIRLSKLSVYKRAEYHCVEGIAALRESLRDVVRLEGEESGTNDHGANKAVQSSSSGGGGRAELAKARQAARRAHQQLDKLAKEAQRAARREDGACDADLKELMRHVESARRWYRECFRVVPPTEGEYERQGDAGGAPGLDDDLHARQSTQHGATNMTTPLLAANFNDVNSNIHNSRNTNVTAPQPTVSDEEFLLFLDQVRRNDELADVALDRISHGLSRLHENALNVTSELRTQEGLLVAVEEKVETTHAKLSGLNKRLRKFLAEKNKCDCFMYAFCCALLLGVVAAIAVLLKK